MAVGVVGALVAAVPGFLDYATIVDRVFRHGMAVGPERTATTIDVAPGAARPARPDDVRRPA